MRYARRKASCSLELRTDAAVAPVIGKCAKQRGETRAGSTAASPPVPRAESVATWVALWKAGRRGK